jgi:hypothetical protein
VKFVSQVVNVAGGKGLVDEFLDDRHEVMQRADRAESRSISRATEAAS